MKFKVLCLLISLNLNLIFAQKTLKINTIGKPTDTLIVLKYEINNKIDGLNILNDSTSIINISIESPDRLILIIDREKKWWTSIWIEPFVLQKEITINYDLITIETIKFGEWDSLVNITSKLDNQNDFEDELLVINKYIDSNPESYLSLWFFTHTRAIYNLPKFSKQKLFNKLSPKLSIYDEFKQIQVDIGNRKYPKIGDDFIEFEGLFVNDSVLNSQNINNKWILLNFWSTTCGPCVKEIDDLNTFYKSIDTSKASFISIALDPNIDVWKSSNYNKKIKSSSIWLPNGLYCSLCLEYNLNALPFFVLFDKNKKLYVIKDGTNELENLKQIFNSNHLLN